MMNWFMSLPLEVELVALALFVAAGIAWICNNGTEENYEES